LAAPRLPFVEDLSKLPNSAIFIYISGLFLAFGLLSNLFDGGGFLYNLGDGALIAAVTGSVLYLARFLSRRKIAKASLSRNLLETQV
jgi:hypothetical protein